ncbi:hypothetical protein BY458DRAFT_521069 [Sporodiniella umbellata]|nr:hypothetical protein BY458DRAFT_521069 [Sporodiniella umbellata]
MRISRLLGPLTALMASSCCVIQLVLNLFSFSCAGFSVLTPYRTWLSCLTIAVLVYQGPRRPGVFLVCLILLVSPEWVRWFNTASRVSGKEFTFLITGMGCEACANRIKHQLESLDWVVQARVFFENASALIITEQPHQVIRAIQAIDSRYQVWLQ